MGGDDDGADTESLRDRARVDGAGASEGAEREASDVDAALDADTAHGGGHGLVDDGDDPGGERLDIEGSVSRERLEGGVRTQGVERHGTAECALGGDAAEHDVGVGDGGEHAAAVAGGPGVGAGGARAHAENAVVVEVRDASAARANGVDVEDGDVDAEVADASATAHGQRAGGERDVGRGAAHVEGDDAVEAERVGERGGGDRAAGGAG